MNIAGITNLKNVIYPMTMEITSEFGSFIQVEQEIIKFVNLNYKKSFYEFKEIVGFFFKDIDLTKVNSLNPYQKKWLAMGIFLALPIKHHFYQNQPFSNEQFKQICQTLECGTDDPNIIFSFNKFEISSQKLSELLINASQNMNSRISLITSKLQLIKVLEERLRKQNLVETKIEQTSQISEVNTFDHIEMIVSVMGQPSDNQKPKTQEIKHIKQQPTMNTPLKISFILNLILLVLLVSISSWIVY